MNTEAFYCRYAYIVCSVSHPWPSISSYSCSVINPFCWLGALCGPLPYCGSRQSPLGGAFLRQNFSTPKFFYAKFFYAKIFLRQKTTCFTPKIYYAEKDIYLRQKSYITPNFFTPKKLLTPNFFYINFFLNIFYA